MRDDDIPTYVRWLVILGVIAVVFACLGLAIESLKPFKDPVPKSHTIDIPSIDVEGYRTYKGYNNSKLYVITVTSTCAYVDIK